MELLNDINIIHEKLSILSTEIKSRGEFNMLDINVLAETFFAELMNLIFGYQLKNINLFERNAKAIDLIDTKNKIIVQVSSDNSKGKVQSSLSGIKEEYKKSKYHFIFICISKKVTNLKKQSFEIPKGIKFDPKNDCYDNKTLITHINSNGSECIKKVNDYLNKTVVYTGRKSAAPDFVFPFEDANNLIARDTAVVKLYNIVKGNRVTNLYGFGGSGKTSLINLFVQKYENEFNQKAYIAVNNSIKDEFISKINATIQIIQNEEKICNDDIFKRITTFLEENYKSDKDNLLIIDINNADDENEFCCKLVSNTEKGTKIYPYGWKYIIISRNKIDAIVNNLNLNDNESENSVFLKDLFLKNVGEGNHLDFNETVFSNLFKKLYYSPLIVELLGIYLRDHNNYSSFDEICELLDKPRFKEKTWNGIEAFKNKNYSEKEKTIIGFLRNIVDLDNFSKEEQKLLRHFILWPSDYIPRYVIERLLEGIFNTEDDFDEALDNLMERKIIACQKDNNIREYKLHDMVAASLRLQINVFGAMYQKYVNNIDNILNYANSDFIPFWKCIGYSLSEYDLRVWIGYRYGVGEYTLENDDYIKLTKGIGRFVNYFHFTYMIHFLEHLIKILGL